MASPEPKSSAWQGTGFIVAVIVVLALIVSLWWVAIYYPGIARLPSDDKMDARGNAIGALFSGLAFVGVVAAILLQIGELRNQLQEMHYTTNAMQDSANAQNNQAKELRAQTTALRSQISMMEETSAYEQFFQLVRFLNDQRDDRRAIFDLIDKPNPIPFQNWNPENKKIGERVCTGFNLAGILARRGGLLGDLILDAYRRGAVKLRGGLDPLLTEIRAARDEEYCKEFDWLVDQMNSSRPERS